MATALTEACLVLCVLLSYLSSKRCDSVLLIGGTIYRVFQRNLKPTI